MRKTASSSQPRLRINVRALDTRYKVDADGSAIPTTAAEKRTPREFRVGLVGDIDQGRVSLVNGHGEKSRHRPRGSMRQLLGIDLNVLRPRLVEKDEYQGIARLGHCIAALARYLSGHAACILRNDLRWMATFCPALTLSLSLTRCSTRPPTVARIGYALLPTKTVTSLPVRPLARQRCRDA